MVRSIFGALEHEQSTAVPIEDKEIIVAVQISVNRGPLGCRQPT